MKKIAFPLLVCLLFASSHTLHAQDDQQVLNLKEIFRSDKYQGESQPLIVWINDGKAYISIEKNSNGHDQLVQYQSKTNAKSAFLKADELQTRQGNHIAIEDFTLSPDESKILMFTNSSRVWRSNTKGDYWVYDFKTGKLQQIGQKFPASSLMFAKFSEDNRYVAYVHDFNIYKENFKTGKVTQLTKDGNRNIINGTFDWAYEEEFGMRDGFSWNSTGHQIAFWQLDASEIGTFYMIDNTDSVYSQSVPMQYPKVGYNPSAAKVGLVNTETTEVTWIPIPGDPFQHYLPAMQWINSDLLLIQQLNRKQNTLIFYTYKPSIKKLHKIYTEQENTWVDLRYPDISSSSWGDYKALVTNDQKAVLRMREDKWRNVYKINLQTGQETLLTPGNYDVASYYSIDDRYLYVNASPDNPTQRYLYRVPLNGDGNLKRLTPKKFSGINTYTIAPNGKFALHHHTDAHTPKTTRLISLPAHKTIAHLIDNQILKNKIAALKMPKTSFFQVTTASGVTMDGRMTRPINFNPSKQYPVIFHVYGEPWGTVANDSWIGFYEIFLAQKGFVVINMDNRGSPSLKGSQWRKSIYRKIGQVNAKDQAQAALKVFKKFEFIDKDRVSVWGWSGGGSLTQNLLFQYPEIYQTGVAVAGISNQLLYDNIYQERYMGLPSENKADFVKGSPITHAKNLEGNLLLVHGTGDDNVHYQNMEYLVDELIRQNKQFDMMSYPNRTHHIYEGKNTQLHLYTMITNYFLHHNTMGR